MTDASISRVALSTARLAGRVFGMGALIDITDIVDEALDIKSSISSFHNTEYGPSLAKVVKHVGTALTAALEADNFRYSFGDYTAATLAVERTLDNVESDDLMLSAARDSEKLYTLLSANSKEIHQDLGAACAITLYDRILRASCRYLAELAIRAARLVPLALVEILRQNDVLSTVVASIVQPTATPEERLAQPKSEEFARRYCARLVEQLDFVDIPGVDLDRRRVRYDLSKSFTPLSISGAADDERIPPQGLATHAQRGSFLLIVGEAGAGKSTLMKRLAIEKAKSVLSNAPLSEIQIPLLLKLRDLPESLDLHNLKFSLMEGFTPSPPSTWITDLVESGHVILLFDGLDEVGSARREQVARWISSIAEAYRRRGATIVVSCRPTEAVEPRYTPEGALRIHLRPMDLPKIEAFVHNWHRAVSGEDFGEGSLTTTADQVLAWIEASSELTRLAANPLNCAVMCALHDYSIQSLPKGKSQLYSSLLSMWMRRRDMEREVIPSSLGLVATEKILRTIALDLLQRARVSSDRNSVLGQIQPILRSLPNLDYQDLRPGLALDHIVQRTGILCEQQSGDFKFWHISFRDYLAASEIASHRDVIEAVRHAEDAAWREPIIWCASLLPPDGLESLVKAILQEADTTATSHRDSLQMLAICCLSSSVGGSPELIDRVKGIAAEYVPPRQQSHMDLLIEGGTPLIPLMEQVLSATPTDREARAIVSALLRIGGDAANSALSRLPGDLLASLGPELADGWRHHASPDYAARVLARVPAATSPYRLNIYTPRQLMSVDQLTETFWINVEFDSYIALDALPGSVRCIDKVTLSRFTWTDITAFLSLYPGVTRLRLIDPIGFPESWASSDCHMVRQLEVVGSARSEPDELGLTSESCVGRLVVSGAFLQVFPSLEKLVVVGRIRVSLDQDFQQLSNLLVVELEDVDLDPIIRLGSHSIERIYASYWNGAQLDWLGHLPSLKCLELPQAWSLRSLDGIESALGLEILDISGAENLDDIRAASDCQELALMRARDCRSLKMTHPSTRAYRIEPNDSGEVIGSAVGKIQPLFAGRWFINDDALVGQEEATARPWDDWSLWYESDAEGSNAAESEIDLIDTNAWVGGEPQLPGDDRGDEAQGMSKEQQRRAKLEDRVEITLQKGVQNLAQEGVQNLGEEEIAERLVKRLADAIYFLAVKENETHTDFIKAADRVRRLLRKSSPIQTELRLLGNTAACLDTKAMSVLRDLMFSDQYSGIAGQVVGTLAARLSQWAPRTP
jgi:hypothetical protein